MAFCRRLLLVLLLCVGQEIYLSIAVRSLVYQKDMSEYCRRRVIPSVFLGRQVVEANSQILHFSRLELPYSCFISVRTESGSNIILVIQLMSDKTLKKSCKESGSQLAVYKIGESFGGYWGPLPDNFVKPGPSAAVNFYTAKTTEMPSTTEESSEETDDESEKPISNLTMESAVPRVKAREEGGDFITMELPIVNVSAKLVPGNIPSESVFKIDDSFDVMYDVTPGVGVQYQSSVMPLVQFSIDNVVEGKRRGGGGGGGAQWSPRYGMDFDDGFTLDSRLNFLLGSTTSKRNSKLHPYNKNNYNRRLNFKKKKQLFAAKQAPLRKKQPSTMRRAQYTIQPYNILTRPYDFVQPTKPEMKVEPPANSWEVIEDILKNISKTTDVTTEELTNNDLNLLHRISDMEHNISAYLAPNLSAYKYFPTSSPQPVTRYSIDPMTWRLPSVSYGSNILEKLDDTKKSHALVNTLTESPTSVNTVDQTSSEDVGTQRFSPDVDKIILNAPNVSIVDVASVTSTNFVTGTSPVATHKSSELLTGSLVDHESWENIVQSAPVMAILLNRTAPQKNGTRRSANGYQSTTARPANSNVRKKRYVYAIPIENARPHKLPVVKNRTAPTKLAHKIYRAQEFVKLVELQDDELHGRVALRYLRQYVGPVLLNICDDDEATTRHVYLFNSSRLVLAINNFTMERMTVVVTPARALLGSEARCASSQLECQVSGSRVCISSLSACDGIPNCGSYDVYDEDRLMCGAAVGLRHNVCLAAFTFLAVLLTVLYTVHYWLKRCVPKVSDAFFIYTDAAENVLYLDSIMRPPCDGDDGKPYYHSHIFQEEMQCRVVEQESKRTNFFIRFITKFFIFFRYKRKQAVSREDMMAEFNRMFPADDQRLYSFTEEEIDKMRKHLTDTAVQTGSSIEMTLRRKESIYKFPTDVGLVHEKPGPSKDTPKSRDYGSSPEAASLENDELSVLKFLREARSGSYNQSGCKVTVPSKNVSQIAEEEELQCLDLERSERSNSQLRIASEIHGEKAELGHYVRKRLRFEEEITTISSTSVHETVHLLGESQEKDGNPHRRSIMLGAGRTLRPQDEECEEQGGSREYKSFFWGGSKKKAKKAKKKTHVSLR